MTRLLRWSDDIDMEHKRTSSASAGPTTIVSSLTRIIGFRPNLRPEVVSVSVRSTASKIEEVSEQDVVPWAQGVESGFSPF